MGKKVADSIMDLLLTEVAKSNRMDVTSDVDTPVNLSNSIATVSMNPGDGNDYTISEGNSGPGSRKIRMVQKLTVPVTSIGVPRHVVLSLVDDLQLITTTLGPTLTTDYDINFPSWEYTLDTPE